jgi:hypothetical protein
MWATTNTSIPLPEATTFAPALLCGRSFDMKRHTSTSKALAARCAR